MIFARALEASGATAVGGQFTCIQGEIVHHHVVQARTARKQVAEGRWRACAAVAKAADATVQEVYRRATADRCLKIVSQRRVAARHILCAMRRAATLLYPGAAPTPLTGLAIVAIEPKSLPTALSDQ